MDCSGTAAVDVYISAASQNRPIIPRHLWHVTARKCELSHCKFVELKGASIQNTSVK
jgi:hypothetical protein